MNPKRLQLALKELEPHQWGRFEQFASAFLVDEFPELRTVASPGGDEGRDAELFSPDGEPDVVLQYSVQKSWETKIRATAKRLKSTMPTVRLLVYVTNQLIGAAGDKINKELRKEYGVRLDIRDRTYFLDRFEGIDHLEAVAESLARDIVDPLLASDIVIDSKAQALSSGESRAAHLFLELQWEDDTRDKGLTKTAFDGLVRMCLRKTSSEARLPRSEIHQQVCSLLNGRDEEFVTREVDKALNRLTKNTIRHYSATDDFCLTFEEAQRIQSRIAETEVLDQQLSAEVAACVKAVFPEEEVRNEATLAKLVRTCRVSVERFLLQRGELFVAALDSGQLDKLGDDTVEQIASQEMLEAKLTKLEPARLARAIERVLTSSEPAVAKYLRGVADAYTLLAFLKQTPDVQQAVRKMFSSGEVWLDTSLVLPLLAEDLLEEEHRQFRRLINIARDSGLRIKVSHGVVEKVERHINRCIACANSAGEWRGGIPFLYASYVASGAATSKFSSWASLFCGKERPEDDVADFLDATFRITRADISEDAARGDQNLRAAVKELWLEVHNGRRSHDFDPALSLRLADHDTDNYVGVIVRRHQEGAAAFGYSSWWLTLDHMAFQIHQMLRSRLAEKAPPSPVMSADFLTNYLAFGPLREKVGRIKDAALPVSIDPSAVSEVTAELVQLANRVREQAGDLPEHVIRRRVRDALDAARRRPGAITERGLQVQAVDGSSRR